MIFVVQWQPIINIIKENYYFLKAGMLEGGRQGGQLPPQILADQKAPPGSSFRQLLVSIFLTDTESCRFIS